MNMNIVNQSFKFVPISIVFSVAHICQVYVCHNISNMPFFRFKPKSMRFNKNQLRIPFSIESSRWVFAIKMSQNVTVTMKNLWPVWGRTRVFERAPHHIARWQKCKLRRVASGGVVKWVVGILRDPTWISCKACLQVGHLRWTNLNDFGAIFKAGKGASSISLNVRKIIRLFWQTCCWRSLIISSLL